MLRWADAEADEVEMCAVAVSRDEGEMAPVVVLDFAWNGPGVLRARKAEKKFAKKGLWVGMVVCGFGDAVQ